MLLIVFLLFCCREQDAELVKATWNKSHGELGLGGYSPEDDLVMKQLWKCNHCKFITSLSLKFFFLESGAVSSLRRDFRLIEQWL